MVGDVTVIPAPPSRKDLSWIGVMPVNVPVTVIVPPAVRLVGLGKDMVGAAVVKDTLGLVAVLPPVPVTVMVCAAAAGVVNVNE